MANSLWGKNVCSKDVYGRDATTKVSRTSSSPCQPLWQLRCPPRTSKHCLVDSEISAENPLQDWCCTPAFSLHPTSHWQLWFDLRLLSLHSPQWASVLAVASARNAFQTPLQRTPFPRSSQGTPFWSCKSLYSKAPFSVLFFSHLSHRRYCVS